MGSPNLRWRGKMRVTWEIIYISAWLGISPVCMLSLTTFCILLLLNVQESVSVDSKFALDQVTSVPKEQNLPMLFNEGENSQVIQHLTLCTSLCTLGYAVIYTLMWLVWQGLRNDFVRNIMWTFEDIHMLVGSNMPIFGGGRYPAVSLRLRLEF